MRTWAVALRTVALAAATAAWPGFAAAGDADCAAVRDHHANFKAILDPDAAGKPQFETVDRGGADGTVAIVRWVDGQRRAARKTLHGVFTKVIETTFGGRRTEVAFSPSIDLAKAFPLRPNSTLDYRVAIGRAEVFQPKFADVKVSIGPQRETAVGGCKVSVMDVVIDWHGTEPGAPVSKSTLAWAPALDYPVAFRTQVTLRDRTVTNGTKVQAIEVWKE